LFVNFIAYDMAALPTEALLEPLLSAQEAIARLDERARRSPHRDAWMQRLLFHEACACQLFEGDLVHLEDLVLLDGHAYSGAPSMALSSTLEILKTWRAGETGDTGGLLSAARPGLAGAAPLAEAGQARDEHAPVCDRRHLEAWRRVQLETRGLPPLVAAAIAGDAWLSLLPESRAGWRATLLAALTLKARGLTANLLLPFDLGWRSSKYRRQPEQELTARIAGFLGWAEAAAALSQKELDSLVLAEKLLGGSLKGRRSSSRMPELARLLLERPFVSVSLAAGALRVSRQAAHNMLKEIGAPVQRLTDRERCNVWSTIG
jgi:hypothetical protein